MKKFMCNPCNYETNDKSNYRKHKKSNKHLELSFSDNNNLKNISENDNEKVPGKFDCTCGRKFSYASGLSRHKKECDGINMADEIKMLKAELKDFKMVKAELKDVKKQLNEVTKASLTKQVNNTFNISVKNYIQQNYAEAPHLLKLKDYSLLEKQDEDEEYDFANILI